MTTYQNYPTRQSTDAVERYRYLLRTAAPDQIEQAHEQAFAQLDANERQEVLRALAATDEAPADASPAALARSATRLEMRQPGALDRLFGNTTGAGMGRTVLASLAAGFVGSAVFDLLFDRPGGLFGMLGHGLFGPGGHGLFDHGGFGGHGFGDHGFGGPGF